jgi:hypothetical protein
MSHKCETPLNSEGWICNKKQRFLEQHFVEPTTLRIYFLWNPEGTKKGEFGDFLDGVEDF